MNNFSKIFQPKDLIFYPGSGKDLQPLFLPTFRARDGQKRQFVYCDFDENVISFYRNLNTFSGDNKPLSTWRSLNPYYTSFFDSHDLSSIKMLSYTEDESSDVPHITIELEITTEEDSFISKLDFFGTDIETYLKKHHLTQFSDFTIKCVLFIKQQYREISGEKRFFSKSVFNKHLNEHALLKQADLLVCDTQHIVDTDNWGLWRMSTLDSTLPGWGVSGNSMIQKQSAVIYERNQGNQNDPHQQIHSEKVDLVLKKLKQLKLNI